MTGPATRRTYLDVLRGVAVLVMMEEKTKKHRKKNNCK